VYKYITRRYYINALKIISKNEKDSKKDYFQILILYVILTQLGYKISIKLQNNLNSNDQLNLL
jgi:ADP-heptose:LPS heptosyltransferase